MFLAIGAVLSPVMVGCGGNQRQKTLRVTMTGLIAARDGFEKWEETRQQQIIDAALTKEAAQAAIAEFREKRDAIYASIGATAFLIAEASLQNDDLSFNRALAEVQKILTAITEIKGGP